MAEVLDTLVVGGGLAGIAATLELQRTGKRVLLVEQAARLGGKASSVTTKAGEFPTGPTSFNGRHAAFWRLIDGLGLGDQVVRLHPSATARFIVRGGKLRSLRPSPLSLVTTSALTLREKVALASELMTRGQAPAGDESLRALMERRFGSSAVTHFFAAVMTGVFAGDLERLSARACMPAMVAAEQTHGSVLRGLLKGLRAHEAGARPGLYTFERGFRVIGERATERLPCRLEARVERLEVSADGVTATVNGEAVRARSLVMATEANVAAALLPDVKELRAFDYAPLTLVQWAERTPGESKLPLGFGWLAAPVEQRFSLGTLFVGDLRGESPRRFSTFIGGALQAERAALSDAALVEGVTQDVTSLGGVMGEVVNVVRWPHGVFQPTVRHLERVAALRSATAQLPVRFVGSYLGGAAMKDALVSGFDCNFGRAASAGPSPQPSPHWGEGVTV